MLLARIQSFVFPKVHRNVLLWHRELCLQIDSVPFLDLVSTRFARSIKGRLSSLVVALIRLNRRVKLLQRWLGFDGTCNAVYSVDIDGLLYLLI